MYTDVMNSFKAYSGFLSGSASEFSEINRKGFEGFRKQQTEAFESYTKTVSEQIKLFGEFADPQAYLAAESQLISKAVKDFVAWSGESRDLAVNWSTEANAWLKKYAAEMQKFAWYKA